MDYRRLQHSYQPRPSPLGAPERPDPPRTFAASVAQSRRPETDESRPHVSPTSTSNSTSPSQIYPENARSSRDSHTSHALLRGNNPSAYFQSGPRPTHRRHGSLESRHHGQSHRRNNSQPQSRNEGTQFLLFPMSRGSPRFRRKPRIGVGPALHFGDLTTSSKPGPGGHSHAIHLHIFTTHTSISLHSYTYTYTFPFLLFPDDRLDSSGTLVQVRPSVTRGATAPFGLAAELPESRVLLDLALAFPLLTRNRLGCYYEHAFASHFSGQSCVSW
jgi:hypothetical protein